MGIGKERNREFRANKTMDKLTIITNDNIIFKKLKNRLWKIRDYCNRSYLSWSGYDLIDNEVRDILKDIYGNDWRE